MKEKDVRESIYRSVFWTVISFIVTGVLLKFGIALIHTSSYLFITLGVIIIVVAILLFAIIADFQYLKIKWIMSKGAAKDSVKADAIKERTVAERLHDSHAVQLEVENVIEEAFEKYEPEIYEKLDYSIGSDPYDNSIEIYFKVSLPYPYEPCKEIREAIYGLGFSIVYWNFTEDVTDGVYDEIRGYEPRHYKDGAKWVGFKCGYADERFNEKEWNEKYDFCKY